MSAETVNSRVEWTHENHKWRWKVATELCEYKGHTYTKWGAKRAVKRTLKWIYS